MQFIINTKNTPVLLQVTGACGESNKVSVHTIYKYCAYIGVHMYLENHMLYTFGSLTITKALKQGV